MQYTGYLWCDDEGNAKKPFEERLQLALNHYKRERNFKPTLVLASHMDVEQDERIQGVQVRARRTVLPHHLLLVREVRP